MNEELIRDCLRMFRQRVQYWKKHSSTGEKYGMKCAYENAADMLEYAINGDAETLANFDYYNEDD